MIAALVALLFVSSMNPNDGVCTSHEWGDWNEEVVICPGWSCISEGSTWACFADDARWSTDCPTCRQGMTEDECRKRYPLSNLSCKYPLRMPGYDPQPDPPAPDCVPYCDQSGQWCFSCIVDGCVDFDGPGISARLCADSISWCSSDGECGGW